MSIRSKETIYNLLPAGITRYLLVKPSADLRSPLHCKLHESPISPEIKYDFLIPPAETRSKTRPFLLDGKDARMHFETETCLRYLRHETKEQMFWIRPLCIKLSSATERSTHYQRRFDLINNANRVRAFMGKPGKSLNVDLVTKFLQSFHDLVVNPSGEQPHFGNKHEFERYYHENIFRQLGHPTEIRTGLEQALKLLCNPIWKDEWTNLQQIGVLKEIDICVGRKPVPVNAFYTLARYLSDANHFNVEELTGQRLGNGNELRAAYRVAKARRQTLRLIRRHQKRIVQNHPLPKDFEEELHAVSRTGGKKIPPRQPMKELHQQLLEHTREESNELEEQGFNNPPRLPQRRTRNQLDRQRHEAKSWNGRVGMDWWLDNQDGGQDSGTNQR